jgi:hypothetical protein
VTDENFRLKRQKFAFFIVWRGKLLPLRTKIRGNRRDPGKLWPFLVKGG